MKECARRPYGKRLQAKRSANQDERNLNLTLCRNGKIGIIQSSVAPMSLSLLKV
jgi:hypothetical protein